MGCKKNHSTEESEDYEVYVNEIIDSLAHQMKSDYGLICTGDGGRMPHDIEKISVKFIAYQRATIEEARELEVKVTERLLEIINSHKKIRPFLRDYPFTPARTQVGISFNKKNNSSYADGRVVYVSNIKNTLYYDAEDPSGKDIELAKEPYEEAKIKVLGADS